MHCHIVPGVDDGSPDIPTSLFLLEQMSEWGLERIYASPHSTQDSFENTPLTIATPFAELCRSAKEKGLPVELHHHFEYRLDEFFLTQLDCDNIVSLPGRFLLIENPFSNEPWGMEQLVYDLINKGYNPVLAHPERYQYYSRNHRNRYADLHNKGLYFQINLLSLAGHYGKRERETALYLLKNNMVQFVGTDLHRATHVESIRRYLSSANFLKDQKLFDRLYNDTL